MIEHSIGLSKIVEKRVSEGKSYMEVLRDAYGADPREIWEIYRKHKEEKAEKIGIQNFYLDLPEPHLAYSQWRLTPESVMRISESIKKKNYKKVCFLGCPVLSMQFENQKKIVLDIDRTILDNIDGARKYDVNKPVPKDLEGKFNCVVADPPWYLEEIKLFAARSAEFVKKGGTIYISLPRLLTRPLIPEERFNFQKWLTKNNLIIAKLAPSVEYEVPSFEYMAYLDIPVFTGEIWRVGDWMKLKKADDFNSRIRKIKTINWLEFSFGKKRVFLREKKEYYGEPSVSILENFILNSVSKRNKLIPLVDIWSSRNAVLHIDSGYGNIKNMLSSLEKVYLTNGKIDEKQVKDGVIKKLIGLISV